MSEGDRLDDDTRRGLKILAASTRTAHDKTAKRLARAAESGQRADYLEAEAMFNSLPADGRRAIGSTATERAVSAKAQIQEEKHQATTSEPADSSMSWQLGTVPRPPKVPGAGRTSKAQGKGGGGKGGSVEWTLGQMPGNQPSAKPPAQQDEDPEDGKSWDWQRVPEDPVSAARRKKREPRNEFEELRRQMLGPLDDT